MAKKGTIIPEEINNAILEVLGNDQKTWTRVVYFFTSRPEDIVEPYLRCLQSVLGKPNLFKALAERLAEDTKTTEENPRYEQCMRDVWDRLMNESEETRMGHGAKLSIQPFNESTRAGATFGLMHALSKVDPTTYCAISNLIRSFSARTSFALQVVRPILPLVNVALIATTLAFDVIRNIRRWLNGEISGKRCLKNVIDCLVGVGAGVGGGFLGCAIGAIAAGPVGAPIGALIGGVGLGTLASVGAHTLSDRLTQWIFGLPQSEALENSYRFLGLQTSASNSEINTAYRKLALKYHPDRATGNRDKWTQLQMHLEVIREKRGERTNTH